MTVRRLNEISQVFSQLGENIKSSVEDNTVYNVTEVYELIDDVANSICANCGMKNFVGKKVSILLTILCFTHKFARRKGASKG